MGWEALEQWGAAAAACGMRSGIRVVSGGTTSRSAHSALVRYASAGQVPPGGSGSVEDRTVTCKRTPDGDPALGQLTGFPFLLSMYVDPTSGNLLLADDPLAGVRGFHGHVWSVALCAGTATCS